MHGVGGVCDVGGVCGGGVCGGGVRGGGVCVAGVCMAGGCAWKERQPLQRRYASYWNAFLLTEYFSLVYNKVGAPVSSTTLGSALTIYKTNFVGSPSCYIHPSEPPAQSFTT